MPQIIPADAPCIHADALTSAVFVERAARHACGIQEIAVVITATSFNAISQVILET
jgi:hypothetical protein